MKTPQEEALDFFYPAREGCRYWAGWSGFFEPCLPSRLFDVGFSLLRKAIEDQDTAAALAFFQSTHTKYLSHARKGGQDVECKPTEKAEKAVRLLLQLRSN
jgi:hypothetical protein